jgi:hypothetical protein
MKKLLLGVTAVALGLMAATPALAGHGRGGSGGSGRGYSPGSSSVHAPTTHWPTTTSSSGLKGTPPIGLGSGTIKGSGTIHLPTPKTTAVKLPSPKKGVSGKSIPGAKGTLLAKGYGGFKYRHWNRRYGCYLFWCPDGWYFWSPACECYLPYENLPTFPPEGGEGPEIEGGLPPVVPGGADKPAPPPSPPAPPPDEPPGSGEGE